MEHLSDRAKPGRCMVCNDKLQYQHSTGYCSRCIRAPWVSPEKRQEATNADRYEWREAMNQPTGNR